jgi:hypothetical protein
MGHRLLPHFALLPYSEVQVETPNYALVQRPARFTFEAQTGLLATVQTVGPIPVNFNRPVHIVSLYPSIAANGNAVLALPSLDDLLVAIRVNNDDDPRMTSRFAVVQPNGLGTQPDVTLGAYRDMNGGARIMDLKLTGNPPQLDVTLSWKRAIAGGPYFQDVIVGLAFNFNWL